MFRPQSLIRDLCTLMRSGGRVHDGRQRSVGPKRQWPKLPAFPVCHHFPFLQPVPCQSSTPPHHHKHHLSTSQQVATRTDSNSMSAFPAATAQDTLTCYPLSAQANATGILGAWIDEIRGATVLTSVNSGPGPFSVSSLRTSPVGHSVLKPLSTDRMVLFTDDLWIDLVTIHAVSSVGTLLARRSASEGHHLGRRASVPRLP